MNKPMRWSPLIASCLMAGLLSWTAGTAPAQANKFSLPDQFKGLNFGSGGGSEVQVSGRIELMPDGTRGVLHVTATLGTGWHIYSVTQRDGGPMRTRVVLDDSAPVELLGSFQPDKPPKIKRLDFYDVPVEEHYEQVTWTAPIQVASGIESGDLVVQGKLDGQICQENGGCVPLKTLDTDFVAKVAGTINSMPQAAAGQSVSAVQAEKRRTPPVKSQEVAVAAVEIIPANVQFAPAPADGFRNGTIHAAIKGQLEPVGAATGHEFELVITAIPDPGWHVYAYAPTVPKAISKPMLIAVVEPPDWQVGDVKASEDPTVKQTNLSLEPEQRYHEREVSWRVPISVPEGTKGGKYTVRGMIGYQTCSDQQCDRPSGAYFSATVNVGSPAAGDIPLEFAAGEYKKVAKFLAGELVPPKNLNAALPPETIRTGPIDFDPSKIQVTDTTDHSAAYILIVAFAGGFILNFMPCVLPVIGLKIMSFVQQAGEDRGRVFALNAWYSLGMLSIFWLLATLASAASLGLSDESLGWGEQFNSAWFTISLLAVVFVMGLSFIGVWEIPIPGFMGSGKAGELAQREGYGGAFSKGILTTILATPCSGPGLATALTWSATKPPSIVYLVFTAMGLGMAMPYLVIGAFPRLVRFIPKPGAWMDTFKQLMGFVLMGTVVYMFTLIDQQYFVPTLSLIFAMWAACWWIGRTPITAKFPAKLMAWLGAAAFTGMIGWFAFGYERDASHELPWQEFSIAALDENIKADRTVLIDFTARWCPTCKVLERSVLNTKPVHRLVEKNEVVTLVADWSEENEEIEDMLRALGSIQLPVIAIFPAGDAYRPSKLTGLYTRSDLVRKLQSAGPSNSPRLASDAR